MKRRNGPSSPTRPLADALLCALLAVPGAASADGIPDPDPRATPGDDAVLYLEVELNRSRTQLMRIEQRGGRLFAAPADLRALGFDAAHAPDGPSIALDALPGAAVRYSASTQRVELDAPLSLLDLPMARLNAPQGTPATPTATVPGLLFNYDVYASHDGDSAQISAATELRLFGIGDGVLSNTSVLRGYETPEGFEPEGEARRDWQADPVRLDTQWVRSFPEHAVSLTVGDAFTGFLDWSRAVRIGGIQVGRDYALQPYRVTTPLPAFLGEATVPSEVELYVNGLRQYSGAVPSGPFQLATVPGLTGSGMAQVVVTDAFGRVRTIDFPFYSTQSLLAAGLSDWSVSAGFVREQYGVRSFAYGSDPVASAHWRYGINDRWTVEAHAEGGGGLAKAGGGARWQMGGAGIAGAAYARSRQDAASGGLVSLSYQWNNGHFHVAFDSQRTHGDYRDIASLSGSPTPSRSERALAGVTTGFGSLSANYVRLAYAGIEPGTGVAGGRYAGLFWTRTFATGWSAHLSWNRNLDNHRDDTLSAGLIIPLDRRRHFNAGVQRSSARDSAFVEMAKPLPGDGGTGWRVQARTGDAPGGLAEVNWLGSAGRVGGGIARYGDLQYGYAQAGGALVWMDGHVFASRTVDDAFALVSTDGIAGVPVLLENRPIGRTDAGGRLVVTPLNAWQRNRITIDALDLPVDLRIDSTAHYAVPRDRTGTAVRFAMHRVHPLLVVLVDASGEPVPLGSTVVADGEDAMVGYDGEVYLELRSGRPRLDVTTPDGACRVTFDAPAHTEAVERVGPLQCVPGGAP